jgi:uncharacterized protein (DUF362 family)
MQNFVHVLKMFSGPETRNLETLKQLYGDRRQLVSAIRNVTGAFLDVKDVAGKRLFLKPNWVRHDVKPDHDVWCLRTHDDFVLAAVEYFLSLGPAQIVVGDAPVQSCRWELAISPIFLSGISRLSAEFGIPVIVKDYRRVFFDPKNNKVEGERVSLDAYTIFDLGKESCLESISYKKPNAFRVTSYDPARLAMAHGPGFHKYCITHELFNSDIVISMPKLKTHQKAGITAALKNIVGLNGDKDFLPHHTKGGTGDGGDCYPGSNMLRRNAEHVLDFANRRRGHFGYRFLIRLAALLWRLSFPSSLHQAAAGWYGNDTTWRMVMDLNKIALYGTKDGKIMTMKQRQFFSLGDGIIGGQGNGPLDPDPLNLGVVTFTNHSGMHDVVCSLLMQFDYRKINLLRHVFNLSVNDQVKFYLDGKPCTLDDYRDCSIPTIPPPGWVEHLTPHLKGK